MNSQPQTTSNSQPEGSVKAGSKGSKRLTTTGQEHKTKNKGGRPPKPDGEQLTKWVKVYFTEKVHRQLKTIADHQNKHVSVLCREYILDGYTVAPITKEQSSYMRKLAGMATNLNQLAHESHVNFTDDLANRMTSLANQIEEVLVWFSNKMTHG